MRIEQTERRRQRVLANVLENLGQIDEIVPPKFSGRRRQILQRHDPSVPHLEPLRQTARHSRVSFDDVNVGNTAPVQHRQELPQAGTGFQNGHSRPQQTPEIVLDIAKLASERLRGMNALQMRKIAAHAIASRPCWYRSGAAGVNTASWN